MGITPGHSPDAFEGVLHQQAAEATMQRPQSLPPEKNWNALATSRPEQNEIVNKAFETGSILKQASATENQSINAIKSLNRLSK